MKTPNNKQKEHEAYLIIYRIIKMLQKPAELDLPELVLKKKLKGCTGICDYDTITLAAFYDVFPTLIHEMIHYLHDTWSETKVIKTEKLIKRYIKIRDVIKIFKLFANAL